MMEFSTPFVSLRSILSTMGLKDSRAYILNGLAMLATFFVCRVCMWPYVMWRYSVAIDAASMWAAMCGLPRGCLISIAILFLPQLYWFYLMVMGALKVCSFSLTLSYVLSIAISLILVSFQVFLPKRQSKTKQKPPSTLNALTETEADTMATPTTTPTVSSAGDALINGNK